MKRAALLTIAIGLLLQSCAFLFYNYRGYLDTDFLIVHPAGDTATAMRVGQSIYRLSAKEEFYTREVNAKYDSMYFYGPDYHTFRIRIYRYHAETKVHLNYSGFHGFRKRPPHREFIRSVTDTLKLVYGATQVIYKDVSNERD